jgi:hypothetical protein
MCLPLYFALSLHSDVRSTIISLSNCAKEPKTLNNKDFRGFADLKDKLSFKKWRSTCFSCSVFIILYKSIIDLA